MGLPPPAEYRLSFKLTSVVEPDSPSILAPQPVSDTPESNWSSGEYEISSRKSPIDRPKNGKGWPFVATKRSSRRGKEKNNAKNGEY